ncbi:hypothetical protein B0H21DRAFT_729213 [Amylocystis lapponica]|nr:hypothetical protein B0H21DRAFT_729213 [Amylocystis lapponica]
MPLVGRSGEFKKHVCVHGRFRWRILPLLPCFATRLMGRVVGDYAAAVAPARSGVSKNRRDRDEIKDGYTGVLIVHSDENPLACRSVGVPQAQDHFEGA